MDEVRTLSDKITGVIELIKFEHTVFALPFVVMSLFMVYGAMPDLRVTIWIIICMVSARSASMAFNRIVDYHYDLLNPRTSERPLQAGKISIGEARVFTIIMSVIFVLSAWMLNSLAFLLSFVMLFVLFGYSYTKRFTWLSHLVLGMSLGCGPAAVWIAARGTVSLTSFLLGVGVAFWVAGFDIIYAIQDYDFDRRTQLMSIPARFGVQKGLTVSRFFHVVTVTMFAFVGIAGDTGILYYVGLFFISGFLFYEHKLVITHGLSRINAAFFTLNGLVSLVFALFSIVDIFVRNG